MSEELKPCSFCNGEGVIYEYSTVETCPCSMRPAQPAEAEGSIQCPASHPAECYAIGTHVVHASLVHGIVRQADELNAALSAVTAELTAAAIAYRIRGDVIAELIAERDRLREENERLKARPEQALTEALGERLMQSSAENYIETTFGVDGTDGDIVVTLRRSAGKTPHELRMEAEAERDQIRAELDELRKDAERFRHIERDCDSGMRGIYGDDWVEVIDGYIAEYAAMAAKEA